MNNIESSFVFYVLQSTCFRGLVVTSAFFFIIKLFFFVLSCILLSIIWPFIIIFFRSGQSNKVYGRCMHYIFKTIFFAKLEFMNLSLVDDNKNYIYVCNHQSFFDVAIFGRFYPRNCYMIAKDSLKYVPVFGLLYHLAGNFYIKREDPTKSKGTVADAVQKIRNNKSSIFILPQGTRVKDNKVTKLKHGFIRLAKETETDILPAVISSYKLKDILFNFRNKKTIYTKICDKISYTKPDDEILLELQTLMNKTISELDSLP